MRSRLDFVDSKLKQSVHTSNKLKRHQENYLGFSVIHMFWLLLLLLLPHELDLDCEKIVGTLHCQRRRRLPIPIFQMKPKDETPQMKLASGNLF